MFHLARKQFQYLISHDKNKLNEQYKKDNVDAVESLLDSMLATNVQNLIYVSDAYACLACEDNFGNSEEIHHDTPSSFMLGYYGETRTKGELIARKKVGTKLSNGQLICQVFFMLNLKASHCKALFFVQPLFMVKAKLKYRQCFVKSLKHTEASFPTFKALQTAYCNMCVCFE